MNLTGCRYHYHLNIQAPFLYIWLVHARGQGAVSRKNYCSIKQYLWASKGHFFSTGNLFSHNLNNFILEKIRFDYCKWPGVLFIFSLLTSRFNIVLRHTSDTLSWTTKGCLKWGVFSTESLHKLCFKSVSLIVIRLCLLFSLSNLLEDEILETWIVISETVFVNWWDKEIL